MDATQQKMTPEELMAEFVKLRAKFEAEQHQREAELQAKFEAEQHQREAELQAKFEAEQHQLQAKLQAETQAKLQAQLRLKLQTQQDTDRELQTATESLDVLQLPDPPSASATQKLMRNNFMEQSVCSQEIAWAAARIAQQVSEGQQVQQVTLAGQTISLVDILAKVEIVDEWLHQSRWCRGSFKQIRCEAALTAQFAKVLDTFLFGTQNNGVVLHQSPTHVMNSAVRLCDIMAFKCSSNGENVCPVLVCDAKLDDSNTSLLQTRAYTIDLQQQMFDNNKLENSRPLMVGLMLTTHNLGVELHFPIPSPSPTPTNPKSWRYGYVNFSHQARTRKQLLVILYMLVHALIGLESTLVPLVRLPHTLLNQSIRLEPLKQTALDTHVFRKSGRVFKLFDDLIELGIRVLPVSQIKQAIECVPEALRLQDVQVEEVGSAAIMSYKWESGNPLNLVPECDWQCLRSVFDTLVSLHTSSYVHGDVRDANIIVNGAGTKLIDLDFVGTHNESCYPLGYNCSNALAEVRHPDAKAGGLMLKEHDLFSLGQLIRQRKGPEQLVQALESGDTHTATQLWSS